MQQKKSQKGRRKYDVSFKQEVVNMIAAGRSVADIARSLGIGENIIYRWLRQALGSTDTAPSESTPPTQVSLSEHLALQKQLRELEMEREILRGAAPKKALGIFSRSQ